MPAQWGISESHQLNEACEVPLHYASSLDSFPPPSLFWPDFPRHFICLPVCGFGLFSLICRLYTGLPKWLIDICQMHWPLSHQHTLCPAAVTLSVLLTLHASPHLAVFPSLIPHRLLVIYFLLQHWLLSGEHNCICKCLSLDSCCLAELYCVSGITPCQY